MSTRCPTERLTPEEKAAICEIIEVRGRSEAARVLGLRDLLALMTAAAGFAVHRLTVATIRAKLPTIERIV